jgi:hypothetical protein
MRVIWLVLVLGCGGGTTPPSNVSTGTMPPPPGACVDPLADATKRMAGKLGADDDPIQAAPTPDLDGDGTADRSFPSGLGVTTSTLLYVMRGACGHFVGDVGGPPQTGVTDKTNGWFDIKVLDAAACEGARCGCDPGELWFAFDGTTYQKDAKRSRDGAEKPCTDGAP